MSNWGYIGLAYGVVWVGFAIFRIYLGARRREVERLLRKERGV